MNNETTVIKNELYRQLAAQCRQLNDNLFITKLELNKLTKISRENVINQIGIINGSLLIGANNYFQHELINQEHTSLEENTEVQESEEQLNLDSIDEGNQQELSYSDSSTNE